MSGVVIASNTSIKVSDLNIDVSVTHTVANQETVLFTTGANEYLEVLFHNGINTGGSGGFNWYFRRNGFDMLTFDSLTPYTQQEYLLQPNGKFIVGPNTSLIAKNISVFGGFTSLRTIFYGIRFINSP